MNTTRIQGTLAASLVGALTFTTVHAQQRPACGIVKSRLGDIEKMK